MNIEHEERARWLLVVFAIGSSSSHPIQGPGRPNLAALARPRPIALPPSFGPYPTGVCELPNISLVVAGSGNGWSTTQGGPAWQVWRDGSQPPQQLPPATAGAMAVLPVGEHARDGQGDAWLVVSFDQNRVERTGGVAWQRTDLGQPWAAAVVAETVLVTENSAGQVVCLALSSGATVGTFGKGTLRYPRGIAVSPATSEIVVADWGTELVHVRCLPRRYF